MHSVKDQFHRLYYESSVWCNTLWLGIPTLKCPLDLWIYQEIIFDTKPDCVIETGTAFGGSAYYIATICDLVDRGEVITVDVEDRGGRPVHNRITYMLGSSTSQEILNTIRERIKDKSRILVILDSDHSEAHVRSELRIYSEFVTRGSYLIVEDTNVNGHPVGASIGPGPMEAVDAFLKDNHNFIVDIDKEKFFLTFNPRGYLKRVS